MWFARAVSLPNRRSQAGSVHGNGFATWDDSSCVAVAGGGGVRGIVITESDEDESSSTRRGSSILMRSSINCRLESEEGKGNGALFSSCRRIERHTPTEN